jgi:hypothetical protein
MLGGSIATLLQPLPRGRLTGPQVLLNLTPSRRFALDLDARCHPLQPVLPLDLTHDHLLALVVVAVAGHATVESDAVRQDMDMLMAGVGVPRHHKLVIVQPHTIHISLANLPPLLISERFTGSSGERNMQNRLAQVRPKLTNFAKLRCKFTRIFTSHVLVDDTALLFREVVFQRPTEAFSLHSFGNHSLPFIPSKPSRS